MGIFKKEPRLDKPDPDPDRFLPDFLSNKFNKHRLFGISKLLYVRRTNVCIVKD